MSTISGSNGKDILRGTAGRDTIVGNDGNDVLKGGGGDDLFVFQAGNGRDRITDFGPGDKIVLDDITPKEVRFSETDLGIKVSYGHPSDGDSILLVGVHDMSLVYQSFVFTADLFG